MMAMRRYQGEGETISLLGFGAMRLPTRPDGERRVVDTDTARAMIDRAMEGGINYFDTAYVYHGGESERFLGEALVARHPRDQFHLATKLPLWGMKTEADIDRLFDEQCGRCKTDYFDYYLVHNLNKDHLDCVKKFNVYEKLMEKKRAGRIRRLGFSFHDQPSVLEDILRAFAWDFGQIQLNYLDWTQQNAQRQYELLGDAGIPVIVMEPVRGGSLANLPAVALDILRERHATASAASWALRYAASLPNVLTVLSGMSTMEQLDDNLATFTDFRPLDDGERKVLDQALTAYRATGSIPCTACRYCMDCPSGVDIPSVFTVYNQSRVSNPGNEFYFGMEYSRILGEDRGAERCVKCGVCVPKCPQRIDIPAGLGEVAAAIAAIRAG